MNGYIEIENGQSREEDVNTLHEMYSVIIEVVEIGRRKIETERGERMQSRLGVMEYCDMRLPHSKSVPAALSETEIEARSASHAGGLVLQAGPAIGRHYTQRARRLIS